MEGGGKGGGMIVRGGGQSAGGTFLESLCPGPPQLPERALGGLTVSPSHISKTVPPAVQPRANMALLPVTPPPTRHTTGIERPRCVDRLPSHISKMVVSTVCGGGLNFTVDTAEQFQRYLRRLMQLIGLEAIYRRPNTSKPNPGVGHRHHLHTHGSGFPLLGGYHGLAQPLRAGLAAVQHPGGRLLCCGSGRSLEQGSATDLSTPTRAASSPARPSPACCWRKAFR